MGKTVGYDGQEKERQVNDERVPPNGNAPGDVPPFLKDLAAVGGPGYAHST